MNIKIKATFITWQNNQVQYWPYVEFSYVSTMILINLAQQFARQLLHQADDSEESYCVRACVSEWDLETEQ